MKTEHLSFYRAAIAVLVVLMLGLATTTAVSLRRARALARDSEERAARAALPPPSSDAPHVDDVALLSLKAENAKLRATNEQLRRELDSREQEAKVQTPALANVAPTPPDRNQPGAWLERVRQEDPERYKQIQEEREQRREAVQNWYNDQYKRLDDRLQAAQMQDEADLVTQISDTLEHIEDLSQRWREMRDLPEEERRARSAELGGEMRDAYQNLRDLRTRDRDMQLGQLAAQLGYGSQPDKIIDPIKQIIQDTDVNPMRGFGGRRGPGGGDDNQNQTPTQ